LLWSIQLKLRVSFDSVTHKIVNRNEMDTILGLSGIFYKKKQIFLDSKQVRVYFHATQTTSAFNRCFKDGYVAQLVRAQHS